MDNQLGNLKYVAVGHPVLNQDATTSRHVMAVVQIVFVVAAEQTIQTFLFQELKAQLLQLSSASIKDIN